MYVCFGFWWWARLPLPEKGRWVGRRVRRVNLERALSRSSARVCAQMNAHREVGSGRGGAATARVGVLDCGILCAPARFNPAPLQFSAELRCTISSPPTNAILFPVFFVPSFFFLAFRHLDLHPV